MLLLIGAAYALSACNFFSQPGDLQTENLANDLANTEIAAVRQTATVGADRLLVTLQFVETSVGIMQQQGTRIAATMVAAGMPIIDTSAITPIAPANDPGATANPANNLVTPVISGQGAASGNITITTSNVTVSPDPPSNAEFGDPVTVTVTVPFNQVSWLPSPMYLGGKSMTAATTMRRETVQ